VRTLHQTIPGFTMLTKTCLKVFNVDDSSMVSSVIQILCRHASPAGHRQNAPGIPPTDVPSEPRQERSRSPCLNHQMLGITAFHSSPKVETYLPSQCTSKKPDQSTPSSLFDEFSSNVVQSYDLPHQASHSKRGKIESRYPPDENVCDYLQPNEGVQPLRNVFLSQKPTHNQSLFQIFERTTWRVCLFTTRFTEFKLVSLITLG